jgi:hypothetical protein
MHKRLLSFALALSTITCAQAAEVDLVAGGSATVGVRWAPAAFVDIGADSREWAGLHWQPVATLGWIGSRDDRRDGLDHNVAIAGAGVRLVDWWGGAFVGIEGGYAGERTDALSSHEQFISSLGWRGERAIVMVRHISNADLFGGRNLGETMVLAGVVF